MKVEKVYMHFLELRDPTYPLYCLFELEILTLPLFPFVMQALLFHHQLFDLRAQYKYLFDGFCEFVN